MGAHFDDDETRQPSAREDALFAALRDLLIGAMPRVPALAQRLAGFDPAELVDRAALARIPVLRKTALMESQAADPPFGGHADTDALVGRRVFQSPGPIWRSRTIGPRPRARRRAPSLLPAFAGGIGCSTPSATT